MHSDLWSATHPDKRPALLLDVQRSSDTRSLTLIVSGELDVISAPDLQKAVADALRRHAPEGIAIDLHSVSFLDSAGIKALLLCHADAERRGCRLTLARPRPTVSSVLEMTALLDHFGLPGQAYPLAGADRTPLGRP